MNKRLRDKLARYLGQSSKLRPRGRPARVDRYAVARESLALRLPVERVAREYRISQRHVFRLVAKVLAEPGEPGATYRRLYGIPEPS